MIFQETSLEVFPNERRLQFIRDGVSKSGGQAGEDLVGDFTRLLNTPSYYLLTNSTQAKVTC